MLFTVGIFGTNYWLGEEIAWRVTVWELYLAKERKIYSVSRRYWVISRNIYCLWKRHTHFSAEIPWICLETLIHGEWYYELLLCLTSVCGKIKKKPHTICHFEVGVLTLWEYETKRNMISVKRKQSIWQALFPILSENPCKSLRVISRHCSVLSKLSWKSFTSL